MFLYVTSLVQFLHHNKRNRINIKHFDQAHMSDSDDDKPLDPTSYFLHELRREERWDAEAVDKYGKETLEELKSIDFGNLPESVAFLKEVKEMYGVASLERKRSIVWRQTGFMFPLTFVYASKEVQAYYKHMHVTQTKIVNAITNIVNNDKHKVTTDELLQPLFSWILRSFDRPLPAKFAREFDPGLFSKSPLKTDVAHGKGSGKHFEFLTHLLGYALALQAQTSDATKMRRDPASTFHEILDIWSEELENEQRRAKDQRARARETVSKKPHKHEPEVPKVPKVPDSWEDDDAWDDEDPSDKLKNMKVRAAAHATDLRLLLTRLQQQYKRYS
jgi:hypothetical protein